MKILKRFLLSLSPFVFASLLLCACEQNKGMVLEPELAQTHEEINQPELNFVSLDAGQNELAKPGEPIIISTIVTRKDGGQLKRIMDGSNRRDEKFENMRGRVTLDFPPQAVNEKVNVSLKIMRGFFMGFVELEYSPHGLIFNMPAILNIRGHNLDLSGIDPNVVDKIELYYTSQENGVWVKMRCKEIFIDLETGTFRVVDGELPHFSRYALAYSN